MQTSTRGERARAPGRVEADAGGDRHVQALYAAVERNADDAVARVEGQAPQACAFRAEHPRDRAGEISRIKALSASVGAHDPRRALLQLAQRSREVGYRNH